MIYGEHIQSTLRQVAWNWQLTSWWSCRKRVKVRKKNTLWPGENGSFRGEIEASNWSAKKYFSCHCARTPLNVRESKIVSDSRFHAMDFGFPALNFSLWWWNLDSGRQSLVRFQISKPKILDFTGKIIDPGFRIPRAKLLGFRNPRAKRLGFRIPRAKLLGFRILRAKLLGVWNPDSLTWGDLYLGLH